jgi:hypothetical protein
MAENENMGGITVPVKVGAKVNVTKFQPHSRKSVLFLNKRGQFHMLPEDMAIPLEKKHEGHIIEKSHKNYVAGFKAAIGYDEKIGTKKFSQVAGKVQAIEDTGRIDLESLVQKETMESERAKKDAAGK